MWLSVFLANAALLGGAMFLLWLWSLAIRNASIIDIAWGPAFVVLAWRMYLTTPVTPMRTLVVALVTVWGVRLGLYLARRNIGHGEDYRYRDMRNRPGRHFASWSLVWVFGFQSSLALMVSLPIHSVFVRSTDAPNLVLAAIGVASWCTGLFFETVGDWQLRRFKADPSNAHAVMDRGLWRYTRHPNYFGDFMVWWGLYFVALGAGAAWWTIVGPITMTVLLLRVTGVPILEEAMLTRRPGYAEYVRRTSSFFPRPPKP